MKIFTIGFTKKSAETFFNTLTQHRVRRLIDIRLKPSSQLAGFAKKEDLPFFLNRISGIEYAHEPRLAPTAELLNEWRKGTLTWPEYEKRFNAILNTRAVEQLLDKSQFEPNAALLCSEATPDQCHRRLVAEYLAHQWKGVRITHL